VHVTLAVLGMISVSVSNNSLAIGILSCVDKSGTDRIKGSSICISHVHARSKVFHVEQVGSFLLLLQPNIDL
jgi:hypothetical protein